MSMGVNGRKRRKQSCICLLILVLALAGCTTKSHVQDKIKIIVIAKSTKSNFWKTVESGVNTAAAEYNVDVIFEGPENEEDYKMQNQMIGNAIHDQVDAIVLSAIDSNASVKMVEKAIEKGIHVVMIDSGVNTRKIEAEISTDNYEAGKMAAQPLLSGENKHLKIGIVNFDRKSANGQQREKGFRDRLANVPNAEIYKTVNVDSNIASAANGTKKLIADYPELNTIITFNEWTTLGVGYAISEQSLGDRIQVIGFDNNVISVDMLQTGEIDGLIVQNPFAEGYLGIENAYRLIKSNQKPGMRITTETTLVTKENMFDKETQKILFPLDSKN